MISDLAVDGEGVRVSVDGRSLHLSWMWLRDHARDESSYLASAEQRLVSVETVAGVAPGDVELIDDVLRVRWPGVVADFPQSMVAALDTPSAMYDQWSRLARPWTGEQLRSRLFEVDHDDFRGDGFSASLAALAGDGVIVIRDVPTATAATRACLEQFGYIRSTIFGDLWTFGSDGGFDDTASTSLEITPHTDGTYSNDAPGMLALHCHLYEATGGENVFVDSHAVAARLTDHDRELLGTIDIPGRYIGDGAHLVAQRPVLRYVDGRLRQVSYNHHDRAPFLLPEPTMSDLFGALHRFDALLKATDLQFEVELRPGDMVCFDNWRVLHGRRSFHGERFIAGGYINREDLESALRTTNPPRPPRS